MSQLLIIGAGGHGKVVAETAAEIGYRHIAFLDRAYPERSKVGEWEIVGEPESCNTPMFCAVGDNSVRQQIFDDLELRESPVLIHPSAVISPSASLGAGTIAVAGSIVNASAEIGKGVILNTGCSVDHDCKIGNFVHISPGARLGGNVTVGAGSWIGIGASIRHGTTIGKNVMVAAGAVVVGNVEDNQRVAGIPARSF